MLGKKAEGHLALFVSKTFSGLNANALKYLVPVWMAPLAGVTLRVVFGAVAFWVIDWVFRNRAGAVEGVPDKQEDHVSGGDEVLSQPHVKQTRQPVQNGLSRGDVIRLLLVGVFGFYVFQVSYLTSLKYTTPVSVSILGSLLPVWTFLFGLLLYKTEKFSWNKTVGLSVSVAGAVLSMFSKRPPELASDPLLGDSLAIVSSVAYSLFLLYSQKLLKKIDNITMLKWSFTGAALAALVVGGALELWQMGFVGEMGLGVSGVIASGAAASGAVAAGATGSSGLLSAPILHAPLHWVPLLVLLFVLIFPTVLSFLLLETGLKLLPATVVASYNNVLIVVATGVSLVLGQDVFSWTQMGAIVLLFVGLYFIARD